MKNSPLIFSEQSKEELIEIILKQQKRIEELEKVVQEKQKSQAHKEFLKHLRLAQKVKHPKTPGQKAGHEGLTRIKPSEIDRTVESRLKHCPDCHGALSKSQEVITHIQEDIIPAHREVTYFKKHRYWCRGCEKIVMAPYAPEEVPHGYLGPNILVQTVMFKYHHGLPFNKIQELFESLCHFKVSEGALAQALQRMSEWLGVEMAVILKAIRSSPNIHADETGWKISGSNHWLWAFVNERLALYRITKSRGSKIPKEVLKDFKGILTTDFYAAYNMLTVRKQKCLVHLMREMHELFVKDQSPGFLKYYKRLKRIIEDALKLKELHETLEPDCYQRRIKLLEKRLFLWSCREHENKNLKRLSKRFLKHWLHLLTFLKEPGISSNNNLAERMIRPHVIIRNRSFQNRSEKASQAHEVLMSLLHTCTLQKRDAVSFFKEVFLKHRQGFNLPRLALQ